MFGFLFRFLNRSKPSVESEDNIAARHVELAAVNKIRADHIDSGTSLTNDAWFAIEDKCSCYAEGLF